MWDKFMLWFGFGCVVLGAAIVVYIAVQAAAGR